MVFIFMDSILAAGDSVAPADQHKASARKNNGGQEFQAHGRKYPRALPPRSSQFSYLKISGRGRIEAFLVSINLHLPDRMGGMQ
jgi:hypothetical protein